MTGAFETKGRGIMIKSSEEMVGGGPGGEGTSQQARKSVPQRGAGPPGEGSGQKTGTWWNWPLGRESEDVFQEMF